MAHLGLESLQPFRPASKYNHSLDVLTYRASGGTAVADRVDRFLTILWDKDQSDVIGVKFKGFRYLFNSLKAEKGWEDGEFLPLVSFLEAVFDQGLGDQVIEEARRKYELAKECVRGFHLTRDELCEIAA